MQPQQPPYGQPPQSTPWGGAAYDGGYGGATQQPYGQQMYGGQQLNMHQAPPSHGSMGGPMVGQPYNAGMGGQMSGPPSHGGMAGPMSGPPSQGGMAGPMGGPPSQGGGSMIGGQFQPAHPQGGQISGDPLTGMLASGVASGALQSAYGNWQRGQQYLQSKMSMFSGGTMYHFFAITSEYVRRKLFLLLMPFLKKWDFARYPEQVTGGQKFLAPRQDLNAPDLYIPFMSLCTYCIIVSIIKVSHGTFKPDALYNTAWYGMFTWVAQLLLLKTVLYMLGIASFVPWLELLAYSGYMFFYMSLIVLAGALGGSPAFYTVWLYGSAMTAVFLVRTMKRIIFHEVRQYSGDRTMHNYLLLGVAVAQFPLGLWLGHI